MKFILFSIIFVFGVFSGLEGSGQTLASANTKKMPKDGGGNGGDGYVDEFTGIAWKYYEALVALAKERETDIDPEAFKNVILTFDISSTPEVLYLDGIPKDILNYPLDKIMQLSRPRIDSLPDRLYVRLVAHEVIGSMGLSDRHYERSSPLVEKVLPGFLGRDESLSSVVKDSNLKTYCDDVQGELNFALTQAALAHTHQAEKIMLVGGIQKALTLGNPKQRRFFSSTLKAALADYEAISEDDEIKVFFLRFQMTSALEDLKNFDSIASGRDFGGYIKEVLGRAQQIGGTSRTAKEEVTILARASKRGISILDSSDYRRTTGYQCSIHTLVNVVDVSDDTSMSYQQRALVMRSGLSEAIKDLDTCH